MNELQIITNQSLIDTLIDLIKHNPALELVTDSKSYSINGYKLILGNKKLLSNKVVNSEQLLKNYSKLNLYFTQNKIASEPSNVLFLKIAPELSKTFLLKWLEILPKQYHNELFSISGKVMSFNERLNATTHDLELFKQSFITKKKIVVPSISNSEFKIALNTLKSTVKNPEEQKDILYSYCANHSSLFNRIEMQNFIYNFLKQSFKTENILQPVLDKFSPYLKNINQNEYDYFHQLYPTHVFQINKKLVFTMIYNENFNDKYQVVTLMNSINQLFTNPEILKKCFLNKVFLNDTDAANDFFTWTFITNCNENKLDYKKLLTELIEKGAEYINPKYNELTLSLIAITNHYLLDIQLNNDNQTTKKTNKI